MKNSLKIEKRIKPIYFKLKVEGYNKLPKWLKKSYIKAVKSQCQDCGSSKNLTIHRIIQGYKGGLYIPQNCKVLCEKCHKKYNEQW